MILEEATKEAFGYSPSALKPQSGKRILAECDDCGKVRIMRKNRYRTLCNSCCQKGKTGDKNGNYKGGLVTCICPTCSNEFKVKQYLIKAGYGKYCSISCAMRGNTFCSGRVQTEETRKKQGVSAIKRMHNSPPAMTAPEKAFKAICIKNDLPFVCNVNAKKHIGNAIPDFIHKSKKIVVDVFGDYWHSVWLGFKGLRYKQTVEGRTAQLKSEGYKCIIVWESDLMREDAEIFVIHLLQKRGII